MNWNAYSALEGSHAFLSPSKYYWVNYPPDKLAKSYENHKKILMGTRLHSLASELIKLRIRLPNTTATLNQFVNDAIGFGMETEKVLYYSPRCYGTADAILFDEQSGTLRIHDLKTGATPASMQQVMIYAGIFYLEYKIFASNLKEVILRLYQNDSLTEYVPALEDVLAVSEKIAVADKILKMLDEGE